MAAPRKDTPKRDDELAWDKESGEGSTVLEDDASNDHIGERVRSRRPELLEDGLDHEPILPIEARDKRWAPIATISRRGRSDVRGYRGRLQPATMAFRLKSCRPGSIRGV